MDKSKQRGEPRFPVRPVSDAVVSRQAERRRDFLKVALDRNDMTPAELARKAGLSNANGLYNFFNGRSSFLSQPTLEKLAAVLPGYSPDDLTGAAPDTEKDVNSVVVRTAVKIGGWRDSYELPLNQQNLVGMPVRQNDVDRGVYGARIDRPGTEKLYPNGGILAVIPLVNYGSPLNPGMQVILQRLTRSRIEVTLREIDVVDGQGWLSPPTTHPKLARAISMPWPNSGDAWRRDNDRFTVVGVVVSAWTPLLPPEIEKPTEP